MQWIIGLALVGLIGILTLPGYTPAATGQGTFNGTYGITTRVSVSAEGQAGNSDSYGAAVNADGRWVAFASRATNLVPTDTNGVSDVFLYDTVLGSTERISLSSDGVEGLAYSESPALSADGQVIVFQSLATNLVPSDTNGVMDIFVHDRATSATSRLSIASDGSQSNGASTTPAISGDGQVIAFESSATNLVLSDTNGVADIFVHNRITGITERLSLGVAGAESNGAATSAALSADGHYVTFSSIANNLVVSDTNGVADVFVYDRTTGITERVSVNSEGEEANDSALAPTISGDGTRIAFESAADNLVPDDTNERSDIFVHERTTGETRRVSVSSSGAQGGLGAIEASISADGAFVVFMSLASNMVSGDTNGTYDIFRHGLADGTTIRVSVSTAGAEGTAPSRHPAINASGRVMVFDSVSSEFVKGDNGAAIDVFRHERSDQPPPPPTPTATATPRIPPYANEQFAPMVGFARRFRSTSIQAITLNGNGDSTPLQVTADGNVVLFVSAATNLVAGDRNYQTDLFVWRRETNLIERVSVATNGGEADAGSWRGELTPDGQWLLFSSTASNLVANDTNPGEDLFLRDMDTGILTWLPSDSVGYRVNGGSHSLAISADGRWIAFSSDADNLGQESDPRRITHAYLLDRTNGEVKRASQWGSAWGNDTSMVRGLSANGQYLLFESNATNLIADDTNGQTDLFVYNRVNNQVRRVNVSATGGEANANTFASELSADGQYVSFTSGATNLIPNDTNGADDIFVVEWQTGTIERVSLAMDGSPLTFGSGGADISADGNFIVFDSGDPTIVGGDTNNTVDTFVRNRRLGINLHGSATSTGGFPNDGAGTFPRISPDGDWVIFASRATNLVEGKTNQRADLFLAQP
jgi:hypothetical protein